MFVELELEQVGLGVEVDPDDPGGSKTLAYGDGSKWKVHAPARSSSDCLIEQTPTNSRVVIEMEKWVHVALVYRFYRVPPKPSTMDVYVNAQHICRFGSDPSDAGGVFERSSFVGNVC